MTATEVGGTKKPPILLGALAGAGVAPFLPLYVARTMVRAQVIGQAGDRITYGWRRVSLPEYFDALPFMRPEQTPHAVLALDLGLALLYAGLIATLVARLLARLPRSAS